MNRRTFFQVISGAAVASFVPPVWLPSVQVGYAPAGRLPRGLGLGINTGEHPDWSQSVAIAIAAFEPAWCYSWMWEPVHPDEGWLPFCRPHPWQHEGIIHYMDAGRAVSFYDKLTQYGHDPARLAWIVGNEPEASGWTPEQVVQAMADQIAILRDAGIAAPTVIAPSCNINTVEHLAYFQRWCDAAQRAGFGFTPAVHIYEYRLDMLDMLWRRFCDWWDASGRDDRLIVTECGAGYDRPMADWLTVMPWFYGLLDDKRVAAIAPFCAYPTTGYPGFMDHAGMPNELGRQWMAERNRRN